MGQLDRVIGKGIKGFAPQPGAQTLFLRCPHFEALLHGNRSRGATYGLLLDFLRDVGTGKGADWRGILFRKTFPQLADIVAKSKKIFPKVFPGAKYNSSDHTWTFPGGESLRFAYMRTESDYENYHGHEYSWIGWDELTSWQNGTWYMLMLGCARSGVKGVKPRVRSTTNPWGPGFQWVKDYFQLFTPETNLVPVRNDDTGDVRVPILGDREENIALMRADGGRYHRRMMGLDDPALRTAWGERWGWEAPAGNFFEGSWSYVDEKTAVRLTPPVIDPFRVPDEWPVYRCMDWNPRKPVAIGWFAIADGQTEARLPNGGDWCPPYGSIIMVAEWYTMKKGKPNVGTQPSSTEVARGILEREFVMGYAAKVRPGPADGIHGGTNPNPGDATIAEKMKWVESPVEGDTRTNGVRWTKPNKYGGSRPEGWTLMREAFEATHWKDPEDNSEPEPGLWIFRECEHFIRTVGIAPRDSKKPDDIDSDCEDHMLDMVRYMVLHNHSGNLIRSADVDIPVTLQRAGVGHFDDIGSAF